MTQKPADDRASYLYGRAPDPTVDRRYRPCPDMRVNLYQNMIEEDEEESTTDCVSSPAEAGAAAVRCTSNSSASSGASGDDSNAVVVLRLRPTAKMCADFSFERNIFKHRIANTTDCSQAKIPEKHFTFGSIFPETTSQSEVYQTCVYDAIENEDALTVLTYGTSGSGKTFTLLGIHSGNPGIIPRAIEHIFRRFGRQVSSVPVVKVVRGAVVAVPDDRARTEAALRHALIGKKATASAAASNVERSAEAYAQHQEHIQKEHSFRAIEKASNECVVVWVSFAELYNENVYDLLPTPPASNSHHQKENHHPNHHHHNHHQQQQQPRKTLKVISNDGNVFIKDLNSVHCRSALDAYQLLAAGLANITYATTNINQNSSRSHCVFFVDVIKLTGGCEFQHIAYKFCDLAGSERLKKTDNVGNRLKEAQSINNSLMVLGRCLDAVYHKQSIVPIRDSKLTVLLQASLLGREKIKMIVNMRPSVEYLEENLNVLNFASMAKQIVYKPPTQQELHKRNRNTARFSWFIEHAALSSSPVHKKKPTAAAAAASNGDGNENYANMGNDTQISLLLDDNGLLKMENEDLQLQLDELRGSIEQRELQIRREMIEEFDEREKRSTELWKKRLAFVEQTAKSNAMQSKLEVRGFCYRTEQIHCAFLLMLILFPFYRFPNGRPSTSAYSNSWSSAKIFGRPLAWRRKRNRC